MDYDQLNKLIKEILLKKSESQNLELKAAQFGYPKNLYKTLSSFSNQNEGGTIIFGIDETDDFNICGVYDPQDLQKQITAQAKEMKPEVKPIYSVEMFKGKPIVAAEINPIPYSERPCFDGRKGYFKGSFKRIGDEDIQMSYDEIFNYKVFRESIHCDAQEIKDDREFLNTNRINSFLNLAKKGKSNFKSVFSDDEILNIFNIRGINYLTKAGALIFSHYPQMYFPRLTIQAIAYPGNEVGELGESMERFLDNKNITGSIPEMLDEALDFIRKNIREKIIIDENGKRNDRFDYPIQALREAILNALVHRDYSNNGERKPISLNIFKNRIEIISPGGLFGDEDISQLGKTRMGTRNENIVNILEILRITENRYSGIPIMKREMEKYNLPEPRFINRNNEFKVIFYNENFKENKVENKKKKIKISDEEILEFCSEPRSRQEIKKFFNTKSTNNNIFSKRIIPLIKRNKLRYLFPDHPRSPKQKYVKVN